MKELIGHKITKIFVSDDQQFIKFQDEEGSEITYRAEGDCCSESWFADILLGYKFHGSVIEEVEKLEVPDWINHLATKDGRTRQEYDEVYGFKLTSNIAPSTSYSRYQESSYCEIIFRNSSNGYYGGWCELQDTDSEWYKEKESDIVWEEITEDWRA